MRYNESHWEKKLVLKSYDDRERTLGITIIIIKGTYHHQLSVPNMIELLLKSRSVHYSTIFEDLKVLKRPVEVLCDSTLHLVTFQTAVETRTKFFHNAYTYRTTYMSTLHAYTNFCLTGCS